MSEIFQFILCILIGAFLGVVVYIIFKYFIDRNKEKGIREEHDFYRFIVKRAYLQMRDKEEDDRVHEEIEKIYNSKRREK